MKLKLEKRNCPNCGSEKFDVSLKSKDNRFGKDGKVFTIVKCKNCGLSYINPIFLENELGQFYGVDFYLGNKSYLNKVSNIISLIKTSSLMKVIGKYKKNGKVLDVGCGLGGLVSSFIKYGYDAYGVEINKDSKQFIENKLRKKIIFNDLKKANFKKKNFDIITTTHVLEHVYDLKSFLEEIKNNLKDDGFFYIRVPNSNFFEYKIFKNYAYNLEVPRHLLFFTRQSLEIVLKNAGFEKIIFIKSNFYDILSTPASFYYSIKYFLVDKGYSLPFIVDRVLFFLMILIRLLIRILSVFQEQDIQVIAFLKSKSFDTIKYVSEKT